MQRLIITLSRFWALVAFLYQRGRWRDCPWSFDLTRLRCWREHFPVHPMSWDWSTWITEETKPSDTDSPFKTSTSFWSKKQITQLLTIWKKKRMHFSTHDQSWLPPPELPMILKCILKYPENDVRIFSPLSYLWPGAMVTQRSNASRMSRSAGNLRWYMIAWNKTKKIFFLKTALQRKINQAVCVPFTKEHTQMKTCFCARFEW